MALSKLQLSVPGICADYLYRHKNSCSCGQMHLKTSKSSFADSHVHLDRLMKFHAMNFEDIDYPPSFQFMIANFIDPPFRGIEEYLRHPQVYGTIGIHPSQANNHLQHIRTVEHFLQHEKIKAIGECGLDSTKKHSQRNQELCFVDHITLAYRHDKPIVIHCRDMQRETLNLAKRFLPHYHKIHLHCFTGDMDDVNIWMGYFTNINFGFTNKIAFVDKASAQENFTRTQHHKVVKSLDITRVLLETDSPYFAINGQFSIPGETLTVAKRIADLKSIKIYDVLGQAMENTKKMYNI